MPPCPGARTRARPSTWCSPRSTRRGAPGAPRRPAGGLPGHRGRQRIDRRHRGGRHDRTVPRWWSSPGEGSAPRAPPGSPPPRLRWSRSATRRILRPRATCPLVCDPVLGGHVDLVLGRTAADRARGVAGPRPPREPLPGPPSAAEHRLRRSPTSARCGRRGASDSSRWPLQDRRSGWPLEQVLRAGAAGWRIAEVAVPYRPASRPFEGDRDDARHGAGGPRHERGAGRAGLNQAARYSWLLERTRWGSEWSQSASSVRSAVRSTSGWSSIAWWPASGISITGATRPSASYIDGADVLGDEAVLGAQQGEAAAHLRQVGQGDAAHAAGELLEHAAVELPLAAALDRAQRAPADVVHHEVEVVVLRRARCGTGPAASSTEA